MSAIREQAKQYDIFSTENMPKYVDVAVSAFTKFSFVHCLFVYVMHGATGLWLGRLCKGC